MKQAIPNPESSFERPDGKYWREVYETALERLAALRAERDILDAKLEELTLEIVRFEKAVSTLAPLTSDGSRLAVAVPTVDGIADLGLADACREILKQDPQYRTARGVRDSLIASGYDIQQHTNPLASVHSVLKRLAEKGDIEELTAEGKTRYRWKQPIVHGTSGVAGYSGYSPKKNTDALRELVDSMQPTAVQTFIDEISRKKR